jgi:uncharacterized iron-regulated membrane protein
MADVNPDPVARNVDNRESTPAGAGHRRQPQKIWIIIHRWLGIILGLPIALIGLTGSLIYMAPFFLALQHGDLLSQKAVPGGLYQSESAWVDSVRKVNGDKFEVIAVSAPFKSPIAAETAQVVGHTHEGQEGEYHRVFSVNPYTSEVKGHYDYETTYSYIPVGIHTSLMIPMIGLDIVAILGVIILFSSVTGVYLWWPRQKSWKSALKFNFGSKGVARWFSLHNVIGVYSAIGLFILSLTGVWMLKPEWIDPPVSIVSPIRQTPKMAMASKTGSCAYKTTPEVALNLAVKQFPDRKIAYLLSAEEDRDFFEVSMSNTGDWNARDGDTMIYVDPNCPKITRIVDASTLSPGEAMQRSAVPFHSGLIFGAIGEILVFLVGLTLPVLYVTGLVVWWRRRKMRLAR